MKRFALLLFTLAGAAAFGQHDAPLCLNTPKPLEINQAWIGNLKKAGLSVEKPSSLVIPDGTLRLLSLSLYKTISNLHVAYGQHPGFNFSAGLSCNNTRDYMIDCRDVVKKFGFYIASHRHNPIELLVTGDDYSSSSTWVREYKNESGENYNYYNGITLGITKCITREGRKFPVYLNAGMGNYRIHKIEKFTYLYYFSDGEYSQTRTEWREVSDAKRFVVECLASVALINKRYFTFGITGGGNTATWFVGYLYAGFKL